MVKMLSDEQIRRESVSRIYLSQRTEEEKERLEMEILEGFSEPGNMFRPDQMDDMYLLIRKLRDCGYIKCGVDRSLEQTYRTTDPGMARLKLLRRMIGRCGSAGVRPARGLNPRQGMYLNPSRLPDSTPLRLA